MKRLGGFDFSFQPSIKREQLESLATLGFASGGRTSSCSVRPVIESLATLGFIERKENVVFLGPLGQRP